MKKKRASKVGYARKVYAAVKSLHAEPQTVAALAEQLGVHRETLAKTFAELHRHRVVYVKSFEQRGEYQQHVYSVEGPDAPGTVPSKRRPTVADIMMRMLIKAVQSNIGCTYDDLMEETGLSRTSLVEHMAFMCGAKLAYRYVPSYTADTRAHQFFYGVDKRTVRPTPMTAVQRVAKYRARLRLQAFTKTVLLHGTPPNTNTVQLSPSQPTQGVENSVLLEN